MSTERLVKWSKESQEFFEKAKDNSVILDLVISYGCASQTGEGFEELVNTINSKSIKRKVKKVNITDTSYLYRHDNPEFSKYSNPNVPTEWYLKNKEAIEKLEVEKEIKCWAVGLNTKEFKKWHDKIRRDFEGDENGAGIVLEFRDKVMQASSVAAYKNNTDVKDCIEFMLEETAYTCAFLDGSAMVYPSALAEPIVVAAERYKITINNLPYKLSKETQKFMRHDCNINMQEIDREVISFMKEKVTNVNFFVIHKHGQQLYKNYPLSELLTEQELNAKYMSNDSWKNTCEVIKQEKQLSFEEVYKDKTFLSVESPLVINGKVEGIVYIKGDNTDFRRMMINAIKNGIEAMEGKKGEIVVGYEEKREEVEIRVKDNGQGMSREMAEKIKKGDEVRITKKGGHGIGTQQIIGTIRAMRGKVEIETKEGEGTEFIFTFPKAEKPRWFADKIEIKKGYEVVIVDDEELMHEVWKEKLKGYEKEIRIKFFTQGVEALKYLKSLENKEKVLLLIDYKLKGQEVNGIDIIEEGEMKERHILVKRKYLKVFHKAQLNDISLIVS